MSPRGFGPVLSPKTDARAVVLRAAIVVLGAIAAASCAADDLAQPPALSSTPTATPDPRFSEPFDPATALDGQPTPLPPRPFGVPERSIADVDLADIVFDTFGQGPPVTLADADDDFITSLIDVIAPIDDPEFENAIAAESWLGPDDLILGHIDADGQARAFAHRVLVLHEIVNLDIAGEPLVVTYCPLCGSGVVYDRRLDDLRDDRTLTFSNTSALHMNDMVMFDRETGSYWWHVAGRSIVGLLSGAELVAVPSQTTTFERWRAEHPTTLVMRRPFDDGRYQVDRFAGYSEQVDDGRSFTPIDDALLNDRLTASTRVIGVLDASGAAIAVPVDASVASGPGLATDNESWVVFVDGDVGAAAFSPVLNDQTLTFAVVNGRIVDDASGTTWSVAGVAVDGPLEGASLTALPSRSSFWFAYLAANPAVTVVAPQR